MDDEIIKKRSPITWKVLAVLPLCVIAILVSACSGKESVKLPVLEDYDIPVAEEERKDLKLGVVAGPYGDMFMETIQPALAEKGYETELVFYDNYEEPNFALANGEIDLNMFQHYKYLNNFKFEHDLDLSAITEIPTAFMGIYSTKYSSFDDLEESAVIAIPEDTTNRSRALMVLDTAGIITLDTSIDKTTATVNDLIKNPKELRFVSLKASNLVQSLGEYDMAVINGNFAISGGLNLSEALFKEVLEDEYINVIAVRTEDMKEQFVLDILEVIHTNEHKKSITDPYGKYSGFQRPRKYLDKRN